MTWREAFLSLQLEMEERVGAISRMRLSVAKEHEDAAMAQVVGAMER